MITRTHTESKWTRSSLSGGRWIISPMDDSGERTVAFMSAGSWQNYPNDDRAQVNVDRVVLLTGAPLPDWAMQWLNKANNKSCANSREAFRTAIDNADFDQCMRDANSY
jgi:hypothetical protein